MDRSGDGTRAAIPIIHVIHRSDHVECRFARLGFDDSIMTASGRRNAEKSERNQRFATDRQMQVPSGNRNWRDGDTTPGNGPSSLRERVGRKRDGTGVQTLLDRFGGRTADRADGRRLRRQARSDGRTRRQSLRAVATRIVRADRRFGVDQAGRSNARCLATGAARGDCRRAAPGKLAGHSDAMTTQRSRDRQGPAEQRTSWRIGRSSDGSPAR